MSRTWRKRGANPPPPTPPIPPSPMVGRICAHLSCAASKVRFHRVRFGTRMFAKHQIVKLENDEKCINWKTCRGSCRRSWWPAMPCTTTWPHPEVPIREKKERTDPTNPTEHKTEQTEPEETEETEEKVQLDLLKWLKLHGGGTVPKCAKVI